MRERFSEINITGTANPVPVGAEAQNITLKDGSVLEQALGNINFQENGSIIDQINKISTKMEEDMSYAPLSAPRIKDALSVRRYNKDNILASVMATGGTKRGITASYNLYQWKVTGAILAGNNDTIVLFGSDDHSKNLAGPSNYLITIKNNINNALLGDSSNPITSLRFDIYNSTAGTTNTIYVYQGDETKDFTIPANCFLYRIGLNIHAGNENTIIEEGILKFELKNLNDQQEDTYNVVFDVQQDLTNKSWTTTVAENFVVSKGLQSEARSSLGTIYNSKWEGNFNINGIIDIKQTNKNQTGLFVENGVIGFNMNDLSSFSGSTTAEKVASYNQSILNLKNQKTAEYITALFTTAGAGTLRYGAAAEHNFYIGAKTSNGTPQFSVTSGTTYVRNTLNLSGQKVISSQLSLCKELMSFKDIEDLLLDNTIYRWRPMLFITGHILGSWLAWRDQYTNVSVGIGWRVINPDNEYIFQGFAMSAMDNHYNFTGNPGLFKFRYSFYPKAANKRRKFISYKVFNANPATINQYVQVRVGNGMGSNGFWSSYSRANSTAG